MKNLKMILKTATVLISLLNIMTAHAEDLIMTRVKQNFPETMVSLQTAIKTAGYTVSRVQRVDIGLTKSGFKTDKYRVVFFGKADELNTLAEKYPDIIPYLPLKISIFAENNETIITTNNPLVMHGYFKKIPKHYFTQWAKDIEKIFTLTSIVD